MVSAIISLISNTLFSGLAFIGCCTIINKCGKFFKTIEEEKQDGYKKGFDNIMVDSIEEINKSVESVGIISNSLHKIFFTVYDIVTGSKIVKKNKDGKIVISSYKNKIDELNNKVKLYQDELNKIKKGTVVENNDSDSDSESEEAINDESLDKDICEDGDEDGDEEENKVEKNKEFYLEKNN
jgi:hypothetical protein